jgi:hypothetical protein
MVRPDWQTHVAPLIAKKDTAFVRVIGSPTANLIHKMGTLSERKPPKAGHALGFLQSGLQAVSQGVWGTFALTLADPDGEANIAQ